MLRYVPAHAVADELALVTRRHPVAAEQLLLARGLDPGDRPRDREPLEQQLGRALPRVLLVEAATEGGGVLAA